MKDLSLFTELTISEQEKISGGVGNNATKQGLAYGPYKPTVLSHYLRCGYALKIANGILMKDPDCLMST